MNTIYSAPPFPAEIDRGYFGAWLSGFIAGEGCFAASLRQKAGRNPTPQCRFSVSQRDDDYRTIELIHSFFQVGSIDSYRVNKVTANRNPQVRYHVDDLESMVAIIIPNFNKYPLIAKKHYDFVIWSKLVLLCSSINQRRRPKGGKGLSKWTNNDLDHAKYLSDALRNIRTYHTNGPTEDS